MNVLTNVGRSIQDPHGDRPPPRRCRCHCGRVIFRPQPYLLESRLERYCYRCASARCDLAGRCPVTSEQDGAAPVGPARPEAAPIGGSAVRSGYAVALR
jgi:hypothetical protein